MYKRLFLTTIVWFLLVGALLAQDLERYSFSSNHMGTRFNIVLYTDNESVASQASKEAFARIEELNQIMSDYLEDSELNRLAKTSGSGEAVKVSEDLFTVLQESIRMAKMTDGLFDITIGPMSKFWRVVRMSPEPELPSNEELEELRQKVGYKYIKLNEKNRTVELLKPGMQLDLGGIAKGYAAEEALAVIRTHGIEKALIDAGGDVTLGDMPPGRDTWDVAVPKNKTRGENSFITLQVTNRTVTTSGDLFQFVVIDGERYSHILNPKTGLGATRQIQATVISPDGMQADALASVLTLMDPEDGIELVNGLDHTEAIIFMNDGGNILEWYSVNSRMYLK
ncbi:FAD:protein FMN transferase [Rhodohalobacter sp. 614A]|uniref:FAD:protein FMN transferase n=1 Tax=Rhodohalobacter sp. 614A TaxID=2908649 RepID=UPI001F1B5022|nr:FAD:protein FMN transferase [Rhodohalobacter sp. 614A]